jgi:hypothetical protein
MILSLGTRGFSNLRKTGRVASRPEHISDRKIMQGGLSAKQRCDWKDASGMTDIVWIPAISRVQSTFHRL